MSPSFLPNRGARAYAWGMTPTPHAKTLQPGDELDGRYRLVAMIGEGAYGTVYRAEHKYTKRAVAVKVLHEALLTEEESVKRFIREAALASQIDHPNCIRVYEFAKAPSGQFYLVTELLEGEPLSARLTRLGRVNLKDALFVMGQLLAALAAVHQRGMVHRDVKPENIMIVRVEDGSERVKLLDFGFAKRPVELSESNPEEDSVTAQGFTLGTPAYISPEQVANKALDSRTDLYAAGVVLYRLLVGKPPFERPNPLDTVLDHVHKAPPLPSLEAPDAHIPPAVEGVILKSLTKDPALRYQSAGEFSDALTAAISQATNSSIVLRALEVSGAKGEALLSRHRWLIGAAAGLALILTAAALWKFLGAGESAPLPGPASLVAASAPGPLALLPAPPASQPGSTSAPTEEPAPPSEASPAVMAASELLGAGDAAGALASLQEHLKTNPSDQAARLFAISAAAAADEWGAASELMREARAQDSGQKSPSAALDRAARVFADGGKRGKGATAFLTKTVPREGGPILAEKLESSVPKVREAAIRGLGQMPKSSAYDPVPPLVKALAAEKSCNAKIPLAEALSHFPGDARALKALKAEEKEAGIFGKSRCLSKTLPKQIKAVEKK